jgi:RNA polymerase sigma-70 factor (ECF subfamily)
MPSVPDELATWAEAERPRLLAIVHQKTSSLLRAKIEEEDILQEAISRGIKSYPHDPFQAESVMPWFLQVVNNTIIDLHRHHVGAQKRDASREVSANSAGKASGNDAQLADILLSSITSPSQVFSKQFRIDRLQESIRELPEEARLAVQWRYMEGLSSIQIAKRLNKSDGAIRVLLSRSLKKLEEALADVGP